MEYPKIGALILDVDVCANAFVSGEAGHSEFSRRIIALLKKFDETIKDELDEQVSHLVIQSMYTMLFSLLRSSHPGYQTPEALVANDSPGEVYSLVRDFYKYDDNADCASDLSRRALLDHLGGAMEQISSGNGQVYFPNALLMRIAVLDAGLSSENAEYLAFHARYDAAVGNEEAQLVELDKIISTLTMDLAQIAHPVRPYREKGEIHDALAKRMTLLPISHPGAEFTQELISLFTYLEHTARYYKVLGIEAILDSVQNIASVDEEWGERKFGEHTEIYVDPKLFGYHIMMGANRLVGHPDRDPLNPHHRRATINEMPKHMTDGFGFAEGQWPIWTVKIMSAVDMALRPFSRTARAVKRPDKLSEAKQVQRFDQLERIADEHFRLKGKEKKNAAVIQTRYINQTSRALNACQNDASRLLEPFSGEISIRSYKQNRAIQKLWLKRAPGTVDDKSNIASSGYFDIQQDKKNSFRVPWRLDEEGTFVICIGDQEFGENYFNKQSLKSLYLELRRCVALGLKDVLVRTIVGQAEGPRPPGGGQGGSTSRVASHRRKVRLAFVKVEGEGSESGEGGADSASVIPKHADRVMDLIHGTDPVSIADIDGIHFYQREIIKVEGESEPKEVFVPVGDVLQILEELRSGDSMIEGLPALTGKDVFMCRKRGVLKRAGYQPWSRSRDKVIQGYTQRRPGPASNAARAHLERRTHGELAMEFPQELQRLRVSTQAGVESIVLRFREFSNPEGELQMAPIPVNDIVLLQEDFTVADGLDPLVELVDLSRGLEVEVVAHEGEQDRTHYRIQAVLKVPQFAQYVQGSFISLEEIEQLLGRS